MACAAATAEVAALPAFVGALRELGVELPVALRVADAALLGESCAVASRVVFESADGEYQISVRDTGAGMDGERLDRIFDRYYHRPSDALGADPGVSSGLGLVISRHVVRQHGGDIVVRSAVGEGSEFVVHLPAG